ncbi:MAG TPA: AzlD domain-containing protein [Methylomusa anaerophila]|uniref:Branched-chain amino acid transport protein n=1 Tax=Methylomusa anaerophila TaxID=1930071 RepID=A0A348AG36_9FIRM|nr:AzlD domain-containing protein [Methylomusa anaerophila]BBB90034.1 Branched-chain amino acid transport protein [Methylomusa anaerophila]HML88238.1 AzlD domain-containing protein [Methylomusa anaerophila]
MVRSEMLLIITGMAIVTFWTRYGAVALFRKTGIPAWFARWLKHVPTAILTALIVPSLLLPAGKFDLSLNNHYLLAGAVAAIIAFKYRNAMLTMALGLAVMLSLRWLSVR